jgi:Sodium:solute symporter family
MFTIMLKFLPVFIFALPGVIALALFPGRESKTTFVTLLNELLPTGFRGLVLAALLASLISSTLSVMNSVSTLAVRDFILHFRPATSERTQVLLGRLVIVISTLLGIMAAYAVYKTPDGLYKYLQTISIYLIMPVAPAIIFGILSKCVTAVGALASVCSGMHPGFHRGRRRDQGIPLAAHQSDPQLHVSRTEVQPCRYCHIVRSLVVYQEDRSGKVGKTNRQLEGTTRNGFEAFSIGDSNWPFFRY